MDAITGERYTSFPDLDYGQDEVPSYITTAWSVEDCQLPVETLAISWAFLLKSITGQENPILCLNGQPIKVNLDTGNSKTVQLDESIHGQGTYTGIFTVDPSSLPEGCTLAVRYNSDQCNGHIISTACTSIPYLSQIRRQFVDIICKRLASRKDDHPTINDRPKLSILNPTPKLLPGPHLLHELVRFAGHGTDLAIEFLENDRSRSKVSFEALHTRSAALALRLLSVLDSLPAATQKRNPVIPVLLPQSIDLYVAWLGILKAGAAVCPLNLDAPPERVNFIANDVDATVIVTTRGLAEGLKHIDRPIHTLIIEDIDINASGNETFQTCQAFAEDVAYLQYTSGSTGLPKGVVITHRAATQSLLAHDRWIPQFKRFLQFASPTFDVSIFEIFFPLFRGATLVGCDRNLMLSSLAQTITELEVDAAELTATVAGELLRRRAAAPCLKLLLTIGEMLTRHVIDEFGKTSDADGMLYAMYGPTEAAIHCTLVPEIAASSRVGNIGIPLETVSTFIISTDTIAGNEPEILPIGQVGELAVGGPQLAEYYVNRDEETKKAFVDTELFGRIYRTGDKARLHPNGELECLGRISTGQVKLRGQRVELSEIERVIYRMPGIRSVVVSVLDGILVAFVSVDQIFTGSEDLHGMCKKWLPKFMLPGDIQFLDDFPRLPSGKIDKKALENGYVDRKHTRHKHAASFGDELHQKIAACVETTLSLPVGSSDSLAAAGLDSLRAIKLSSVLRNAGINVDVLGILEADSIRAIAALSRKASNAPPEVSNQIESSTWKSLAGAVLDDLKSKGHSPDSVEIVPCSPVQIAMLSESIRDPKAYFNWIELQFHENIGISDVKRAFCELSLRNELLRSGFLSTDYPSYSHVQVIWGSLSEDQFLEVSELNYDRFPSNQSGLLRPFHIDLTVTNGKTGALAYIHHGLYDGWSWDHILSDIEDLLSGKPVTERPQYRLFTDFHLNRIDTEDRESAINHWRDELEGIKPVPWANFQETSDIPAGLQTVQRQLDIDVKILDAVTQNLRVSRQTIFQAAFGYLLGAYNNNPDIVFGTVSSGRTLPITGIEDIIGPCMATTPLRVNIDQLRTVRDLVGALHNLNRKSLKYGFLPLSDIKRASGIKPEVNLFDSLFVWQETLNAGKGRGGLIQEVISSDFLEFNMTLELEIQGGKLFAKANFQQSVLPGSQVDIFLCQMEQLAVIFMNTPKLSLQDVNRHLPNSNLSIENLDYEKQTNLPSLADGVEAIACSDPERPAVEFLDCFDPYTGATTISKLTYAELDIRSNRLAHYLLSLGLKPDDLVLVLLEKSFDLYVAILAVIKAGGGYLPITPHTPINRINTIIGEANCPMCITDSTFLLQLGQLHGTKVITFKNIMLADFPTTRPAVFVPESSLAYCTFTSGSTGAPKGVLITHRNLQSNIAVLSEIYPNPPGSKLLQACSQAFDVSVFEIFFSWAKGMTLCSATNDILFRDLEQAVRAMKVTHLSLTPTVAALVNPDNVPDVKFLVTAGEAMTEKVFKHWANRGIYQGYGPSETTNICTVKPNLNAANFINNIGRPFKNTSAFVVSAENTFSLVPRGAIGEFCFGGDQVGRGYLNMAALTNEKFICHSQYGRVYRSGDFGRMLPDGSLVFTGRRDDQIKLRGQRITFGEINRAILQDPEVIDCSTLIVGDKSDEKQQLISFWVPETHNYSNLASHTKTIKLFEHITSLLPSYMIPSVLLPIRAIPMTASGKTDKTELLKQFQTADRASIQAYSYGAEDTGDNRQFSDTETKIARTVAQVTQVSLTSITLHSSFYSLGMDSISAISLSRLLKQEGFGQVDVSTILKYNSVYRLSKRLQQSKDELAPARNTQNIQGLFSRDFLEQETSHAERVGLRVKKILPCTPLQEAMLMRKSIDSYTAYYNHFIFEVKDIAKLKYAWNTMVDRHDILRTYFTSTDDARFAFAQVVLDSIEPPWEEVITTSRDISAQVEHRIQRLAKSGDKTVPCSFTIFQLGDNGKILFLLLLHHALHDGEAVAQLLEEVEYVSLGMPLPPVVSFESYLEQMIGLDVEESDRFWYSYLSDLSPTRLLEFKHRSEATGSKNFRSTGSVFDIPLHKVIEGSKNVSATLLSVIQAAWAKLLFLYTGKYGICFGNVFSCRNLAIDGSERIIGPCFNTLPIRITADPNTINLDVIRNLQKYNADIMPYQLTSLRRLQAKFSRGGSPMFDTLILLQTSSRPLNDNIWKLVAENGDMDFPLVCEVIPNDRDDKMGIYLHYDESQIDSHDMSMMLNSLTGLIRHVLLYPYGRAIDTDIVKQSLPSFIRDSQGYPTKDTHEDSAISLGEDGHNLSLDTWSLQALEVQEILSKLSKVDRAYIEPHTTIFQLGLDSINAVQILSRFRELGYEISLNDILEKPSVGELASFLSRPKKTVEPQPPLAFDFESFQSRHLLPICRQIEVSTTCIESVRPCTPVQAGMLALFNSSEGDTYFNHLVLKSTIPLETQAIKEAWKALSNTHEILRAGFIHVNDSEYPFAAITYRTENFELPWDEEGNLVDEGDQRLSERSKISRDVISQLHLSPWRISIQQLQSHVLMQFSALHSLYDAQSLNLLLSDLSTLLRGNILSPVIPILPVQDSIISASTRTYLDPECERFWKELGTGLCVTKFPDMNPYYGEKEVRVLAKSCSKMLQSLQEGCKIAGVTLQAAGQAAWARILAYYTGENAVTCGLVLSGRNISEDAQRAVFPCLTTVPSTYSIEGSNRNLLDRVMKLDASLVKYQFTPLSRVHQWVGSKSSLFDSIFVFQKHISPAVNEIWEVHDEVAKTDYPISIELIPKRETLEFQLTFETDILPRGQAEILLDQLNALLIDTILSLDSPCTHFSDAGQSSLLSVVAAKETKIPSPVDLVHQFVEVQARQFPSRTALEFATKTHGDRLSIAKWSYKEFNEGANRYANLLLKNGARPGQLIGVCFDKCPEAYFAILAILKVGCAYVALDPGAPVARKNFIFQDSGAKLLLCTSERRDEFDGIPLLALDSPRILDGIPSHQPMLERPIQPQDNCYCLYTSGTTGTPKGCEITHDNVVQAMLSFKRLFAGHWDDSSRWLQFAALHFDVSCLEQYWSWSVGICVTSCPRDTLFEDLAGTIRQLEITHIDLTPSLARLLDPLDVPSLHRGVFITGGEQLKQEILEAWGEYGVIYNGYGPTEVTIGCTMLPRVPKNGKPSNIGPAFDNVGAFVFQPGTTTPVIRGGVGELCVSGALVGRGYLNRPELTQEKFQYIEEIGERVYRTGDLVRLLHDDSFCFLGRIDDQIKLRGQRLEIREINEVITQSTTEVGEVITMVLKHSSQGKEQLVSFFATNAAKKSDNTATIDFDPGMSGILAKINEACHKTLPGYMVPTHIIPITGFPLTPNNKVDHRQLKTIYENMTLEDMKKLSSHAQTNAAAPSKDVNTIMSLVSKMTGTDISTISPWSSIFALGLDSISAITFSRLLRDSGFKSAQPSLLMKNSTITALSNALQRSTADDIATKAIYQESKQNIAAFAHANLVPVAQELKIPLSSIEGVAPCTPLQEGMIYRFLESQKPVYFTNFNFELASTIDIPRLKSSWMSTQRSVQILRTKFPLTTGNYAQVVLKEDRFPWFEITVLDDTEVKKVADDRYKEWCDEPSKLTERVWEVGVIIGPTRRWMCLNIFHGLYDGNSLPLLLSRVSHTYLDPHDTPDTPSYLDCLPEGPLCKIPEARRFWLDHLQGQSSKALPFMNDTQESGPVLANLGIGGLDKLETVRRKLDVLEQAVLLACWLRVLEQHVKFTPTLGIVVSGRAVNTTEIENAIGPLFNTLPCNISCSGVSSMADLVRSCHAYYTSTLPLQHTSLRDIMKWLPRSSGSSPLFDNLFVFQREPAEVIDPANSLWSAIASQAEPDYPLAFEVQRNRDGSLAVTLVAQGGVLSPEAAQQLTVQFRDVLNSFLADPSSKLDFSVDESDARTSGVNGERSYSNGLVPNGLVTPFEWTPITSRLREEIAALANVDVHTVAETTSILEVGLDSIDAIKLSSRLKKAGIMLSVSAIMRGRTIQHIMDDVGTNDQNGTDSPQVSLGDLEKDLRSYFERDGYDLSGIENILPATPLQEAMVAEMISSEFSRYYNHDVLEIADWVDIDTLKQAWQRVVDANAILRTSFMEISDPGLPFTYAQHVHAPGASLDWNEIDLAGRSIHTFLEEQKVEASRSTHRPLLKLQLLNPGNSGMKRLLLLSMPHAMYDGWSLDLLHEDIVSCYTGQEPNNRGSCHDVLRHILNSTSELGLQFWKGALGGYRPTCFPKQLGARGDSSRISRKEKLLDISRLEVVSFCKSQGVTLQALGLTCWALVLAGYLKKLDVVFGTVLAGRDIQDAERIMFPLMNSVAIRSILHGSRSDMLKYSQEMLVSISDYQHIPLRTAKAVSGLGDQNLFDTLFIFQKRPDRDVTSQEPLYKSVGGFSDVEYPVCVEMEELDDSIVWRAACRDTVFGEQDVSSLLERVNFVFGDIIRNAQSRTIDFSHDGISICQSPVFQENYGEERNENSQRIVQVETEYSPVEQDIRLVLSSVANIPAEKIHQEATIFHLGLDSISAIKVAALLRKKDIVLTVSDMLRAGTVSRMAHMARSMQEEQVIDHSSTLKSILEEVDSESLLQSHGIEMSKVEKVVPATAGQIYMLSVHKNSEGKFFYPCFFYRIEGKVNGTELETAWATLIKQLPILRTQFISTGKRSLPYVQVVHKDVVNRIVWRDDLRLQRNRNLQPQPGQIPVKLYASQTGEETILMLHIHHALYDAVSLPRMLDMLATLLSDPSSPNKSNVDISELVTHQHITSSRETRQKFWKEYLSPIPLNQDPICKPPPPPPPSTTLEISQTYTPSLIQNITHLEKTTRHHGISIQALFLAIYAKTHILNHLSQPEPEPKPNHLTTPTPPTTPLTIGIYLANRSHPLLPNHQDLIAPTLNIVPLRITTYHHHHQETTQSQSLINLARDIQADLHEIGRVENSCVSLAEIAEWTGVRVDACVNFVKVPVISDGGGGGDGDGDGDGDVQKKAVRIMPLVEEEEEEGIQVDDDDDGDGVGVGSGEEGCSIDNVNMYEKETSQLVVYTPSSNGRDESLLDIYGDVYMPAIDIEAAIRNNALDVGIFGPSDRITPAIAARVLDGIRREMMGVMEEGGLGD
ncbi:NRPS [Emmonsiellopsis sp. PD_5]|nr:NRPS [Emmonsiellopsis sp. PD_5]